MGGGLSCGERGLSKGKVWVVGMAYTQDPQGWKRPWGLWGAGLSLNTKRRGSGLPTTPGLRGWGTSPGSPGGFLGSNRWGKCPLLLSHSSQRTPPACLSWSPWCPPLCPQYQCSHGEGEPWRAGDHPGSSAGSLGPSGWGSCPPLLSHSSWKALPACLFWSPGLKGADPVWPPLLFPAQSHHFTWGFLPSPWASGFPTSGWQVP